MDKMSKSEFLSFLYAEKGRIDTKYSKPGWSNWAFAGTIVALLAYLFDLLTSNKGEAIDWEIVLKLSTSLLSIALILTMVYPMIFPKTEIYYPNRISTVWQESPIFELTLSGLSFGLIFISMLFFYNYSWVLYIFGLLSTERIASLIILFCKRNKLTASGIRFNLACNSNAFNKTFTAIFILLYTSIAIYSSYHIIPQIQNYLIELQLSAVFIGFWVIVFAFFRSNLTTNKLSNELDNIIDKVTYSNMSQLDAMDELMFLRYGGDAKQIVKSELYTYFEALSKLGDINTTLDIIIKNIEEGTLNPQNYYVWSKYLCTQFVILNNAKKKGNNLYRKIDKIIKLPNNIIQSIEFEELLKTTMYGLEKLKLTTFQFEKVSKALSEYKKIHYCRKSGSICLTLDCKERHDKMSIVYAFKAFPLKYAIHLVVHRNK